MTLQLSPAQMLAALPADKQSALMAALTGEQKAALAYHWRYWARPNQLLPQGDWAYWLIQAGRGWGKTRVGAETVREWVKTNEFVNLVGATADDARDIMIEGESGIMRLCPDNERPVYKPSQRKLEWPNGATSLIFTADEPDRLRGKQHHKAWADEMAAWRYQEAFDQLKFGLRLGRKPQLVATTTPKPVKNVKELRKDPKTYLTIGTSYENRENLAPTFFEEIVNKYEGTRLGRQELLAQLLEDVPGALWKRDDIRYMPMGSVPQLQRVVISIDPPASSEENSNEAGIIAAGMDASHNGYTLDDRSGICSPTEWAKRAVTLFNLYSADTIVAEANQGGEMVRAVISAHAPNVPVKLVHATRGKYVRAEPVAALYEKQAIYHCAFFETLEDQMCNFTVDFDRKENGSPDRMDALVWAYTELFPQLVDRKIDKFKQREVKGIR